jgi:hypothetical protein
MREYLLNDYLPVFATAVVAEIGVAVLFGCWSLRQFGAVAVVNLATHPLLHVVLWVGYWWHDASPSAWVVLALELAVVLAEGTLLTLLLPLTGRKAFALSVTMNATSYLIGLMLTG